MNLCRVASDIQPSISDISVHLASNQSSSGFFSDSGSLGASSLLSTSKQGRKFFPTTAILGTRACSDRDGFWNWSKRSLLKETTPQNFALHPNNELSSHFLDCVQELDKTWWWSFTSIANIWSACQMWVTWGAPSVRRGNFLDREQNMRGNMRGKKSEI